MRFPLSAKVSIVVIALVAIGGGTTGYFIYHSSTNALKDSISKNQLNTSQQTMATVDRFLYERMVDVNQLAGREQLQTYLSQPKLRTTDRTTALTKQLVDFKTQTGNWNSLGLIDPQGSILLIADTENQIAATDGQKNFEALFGAALQGRSVYSDVIILGHANQHVMLFMSPVRDYSLKDQPVIGVLTGQLDWPSTLEILKSQDEDIAISLVNSKGISLGNNQSDSEKDILVKDLHSTNAFIEANKHSPGSMVLPGLEDTKKSYVTSYAKEAGYSSYKGNGWLLIAETPQSVAFSPVQKLAKNLAVTSVLILLALVGVLVVVLRFMLVRPILAMQQAAQRVADGDFSQPLNINSGDELGELSRAFNDMTEKLKFAYNSLKDNTMNAQGDKRTMDTLMDNLPVGVMVVRAPFGEPVILNKTGAEIFGQAMDPNLKSDEYAQKLGLVKESGIPYPNDEIPLVASLKTGELATRDDMLVVRPDGSKISIRAISAPIKDEDGRIGRAVTVFEDISKVRSLEKSREEFFSIASHELRTPLTAIRGNTSLIKQYFWDKIQDTSLREMVNDIHESSIRLIGIVNDFLDTSRLEQKRMIFNLEAFDPINTAESVMREYQASGSTDKVHLEVIKPASPLPLVMADRNRIKQILINLVGNSLKFTTQGTVRISFEVEGSYVKILITDTGRGISPEGQDLLFKKFEQTGTNVLTRDSVRGTGLGLYISKMMIEQMHGIIKLEKSDLGVGTTLSFTIPTVNNQDVPHSPNVS